VISAKLTRYIKIKKVCIPALCFALALSAGCKRNAENNVAVPFPEQKEEQKAAVPVRETLPVETETASDTEIGKYGRIIDDEFKSFNGNLAYSLNVYGVGRCMVNENEQMKSASIIKLFIMEYAYKLMSDGEMSGETVIEGRTLNNLIEDMITVSDNAAANTLIRQFSMEKMNEYFSVCGYNGTKLQRYMLDTAAAARGEENYTTAKDVMDFLDKLYENRDKYPYKDMLDVMKRQKIATKLRRDMPSGVEMASKTGELPDTENDVAIVFGMEKDFAIVCLTGGTDAFTAKNAMAKSCRKICDSLKP